ncbi:hypothetical protein [Cystobacter ferrugineus]|uniref:DUF5666 domain-containing protein n=1 Tax=Cystobacter ferrugineus TaxID=83449 RepID=A0A1L9BAN1_9BACT|nr:hypothetical protein [Cystobacter ferrugineus]OJH39312.1 hypothetical protein BON30_17500 [Cystobacter ferrugineus]
MTKKIVGLFATVAMLSSGAALAGGDKQHKEQKQTQSSQQVGQDAYGGAGTQQGQQPGQQQAGTSANQMLGEKQVSGTVVKSSGDELKLSTENGIIAVKVNKQTQFQDASVKRIKDLKEGQQVRTSFTVEKDSNVAKSISLDSGMGGSGLQVDPGINQGLDNSGHHQTDNQDLHPGMNPGLDSTGGADHPGD